VEAVQGMQAGWDGLAVDTGLAVVNAVPRIISSRIFKSSSINKAIVHLLQKAPDLVVVTSEWVSLNLE